MKLLAWILLVCFSLSGLSPLFGNGLIDLVALKKKEEERRKRIGKSKQSVNDSNLNIISSGGKSYGFVQMESEVPPEAEGGSSVASSDLETPVEKRPDFWKNQKTDLEARIAQLKEDITSEQENLNKLWTDFYIKNIPAEQDAIKLQISQLTNQVEQKKLFLSQSEAQLEELFEKARKAGVPPGWLR